MPVRSEQAAGILTLTLSNPGRKNALSTAIFEELLTALDRGAADDAIRVVVLCGAEGDFSSGADLSESRAGRGHWLPYMRWVTRVATALHELPNVAIFLQRTGLTYSQISSLVETAFISPRLRIHDPRGTCNPHSCPWSR